ncbi:MAG: cbb3-type cytochrome c oxidase subunit II [Bacillota bacterium]|nr:MAG: hypothetical protein DIU70_06995 [Bacillota bacterium]
MLHRNAALVALGAFLLLSFAIAVTVALPLMQEELYAADEATPQYSELALKGKQIYQREGCFYCHTQQVRTIPNDAAFQGPNKRPSRPSDYANDNPVLLGTERTGPDLKFVGDRLPSKDWHIGHLKNPRAYDPRSIMPSYAHLPEEELEALAEYLVSLRDWSVKPLQQPERLADLTEADLPEEFRSLQNPFAGDLQGAVAIAEPIIAQSCVACHGPDLRGKQLTEKVRSADLYERSQARSEQFLYWAITVGSKLGMPGWERSLSEEQRWALATYIKNIQQIRP